jgi:hypothetical protein
MNLLILVFVAFTVSYAALWHNKTSSSERDDSSRDQSQASDKTEPR